MAITAFGESMLEVLRTGKRCELTDDKKNIFYDEFYKQISDEIRELRDEQRRAFEESKNLTLA